MIPRNRYVRDREERIKNNLLSQEKLEVISQKKEEKKGESSLKKGSLQKIEKSKKREIHLLPEGGIRNLEYEGHLSEKQLDRIEKLYPYYKQAEKITQVNWRILAAIHYRESSLGMNPRAEGNEFQFDGDLKKRATGVFEKDVIEAGKILQEKAKRAQVGSLLPDQIDDPKIRQALFYYNGPIYKQFDRSPYVLNRLDPEHSEMPLFLGKDAHPQWTIDDRFGVISFARELEKAFPS